MSWDDDTKPDLDGKDFEVFTQFTSTDKKLLIRDIEFWASGLDVLLQFYKETKVESDDDKEAKAVACARLAGFGHAMAEHFSLASSNLMLNQKGVDWENPEASGNPGVQACIKAGGRMYQSGENHRDTLEKAAKANVN